MQNDLDNYVGSGPGWTKLDHRRTEWRFKWKGSRPAGDMSLVYRHNSKWALIKPYDSYTKYNRIKCSSLIAHKCVWWRRIPFFDGRTHAYMRLPFFDCMEICWRCHKPIPEEIVGLWRLHNVDYGGHTMLNSGLPAVQVLMLNSGGLNAA